MDNMPTAQEILEGKFSQEEIKDLNRRMMDVIVMERLIKPIGIVIAVDLGIRLFRKLTR